MGATPASRQEGSLLDDRRCSLDGCERAVRLGPAHRAGAACSGVKTETMAPDYLGILKGPILVSDAKAVEPGTGRLVGPHFQLEISEVAVASELSAGTAKQLGFDSAQQAAAGHEILLVQVESSVSQSPARWRTEDGDLTPAVVVDGDERPLGPLPGFWPVIAVSVRHHAPAVLRVTDHGRPLTMDLRTGSVAPDSLYRVFSSQALQPRTYEGAGTVSATGLSGALKVELRLPEAAVREPFLPGPGWAAPGRAWLWLPGVNVFSNGFSTFVFFSLEKASTFTLLLADGTRVQAQPGRVDATTFALNHAVVFDVPGSLRSSTLRVTPAGAMTALSRDGEATAWSRPPPPADLTISFAE